MHVDDLAHAVSVVFCRSALSDFDLTPGSMHVEEDEQVGRSIALILAVETFELAWSGRDRLAHLADELCRTLVETDHRALRIGLFSIEVEHVLHAGDIVGVDLRNAPHVQAPAHGLTRKADVLGEADHRTRQQLQRPTSAALRGLGTGGRDQQGFLLARELTACSRAWLFAKRCLQVTEHEALLGSVHGRAANSHAGGDIVVAGPRVGGQQNLRSLELARGVLASAHNRGEFGALGWAQFNPIAYIHPCLLCTRGTDEQLNRMADVSRAAKSFTPKQGQYMAFIHRYTRLHRRPPAEADMQDYFRDSPPSVHQMVLTLERAGLIRRRPRVD